MYLKIFWPKSRIREFWAKLFFGIFSQFLDCTSTPEISGQPDKLEMTVGSSAVKEHLKDFEFQTLNLEFLNDFEFQTLNVEPNKLKC